jgi:drug/metabolite transporter (DMT)-like permease
MLNNADQTDASLRHALMLVVTLVAAGSYPAIKAGLVYAPPIRFAGLRTIIAGVVLLGILAALKRPFWPGATVRRWILPLGLAATTLTFGAMFLSPVHTGAGIASVLGNTQPLASSFLPQSSCTKS